MRARAIVPLLGAAMLATAARAAELSIASPVFESGAAIPRDHTCDGKDASPPLVWRDVPERTKAFALIVDDPDAPAGTWTHWVLYDLPASTTVLPIGVPMENAVAGGKQGKNDFHHIGYNGPCPPPGRLHHYRFMLYALGAPTGLAAGASKADVEKAVTGHSLAQATLVGTYGR
jgi:Raf kinase inhibitor-like YbhB/YbcL family protein